MSYKLKYTGEQIDDILDRAVEGGAIDDALALKAPLESPALTGTPTAPTQAEGDDSTKVATTAYADRAADAAEAAAKEYADEATSALYITDTASGSIASFSDGADGVAMRSVKVAVTPVQSGSGDPAPDNVRPISGWTGAEMVRTGKNLLPFDIDRMKAINSNGTWSGNTFTGTGLAFAVDAEAGTVTVNGTATDRKTFLIASRLATGENKFVLPTGSYAINGCPAGGSSTTYELRFQATRNGVLYDYGYDRGSGATGGVLDSDLLQVGVSFGAGTTANNLVFRPMLRLASDTDATFEPYAGQTFPVTWESQAGEVFGGYFVVNEDGSADLTVDHKGITLTSAGQLTGFTASAQYGAFASIVGSNDIKHENSATIYGLCSCAEFIAHDNRVAQAYIEKFRCWADTNNGVLMVRASASSNIQTKADLYAEYANGQFVYDLATPQTYHLDRIGQITSLLGQNNVWSNTGDTEATYVADPKLYIAKVLGGSALTLGSASPLSLNRPVTINKEDLEQAGEVSEAVEAAAETVLPAESGETEEEAQE